MADFKPYYTSDDLIEAVKRKISLPISQETFSEDDILRFCNEEMYLSQVPSVLQYHQEYFVFAVEVELEAGKARYPIPDRAIGLRMRDVMFKDTQGNLYEMTRVDASDKGEYQIETDITFFYIEGNEIVLLSDVNSTGVGSLVFYIFLRPNQLVANERAATLVSLSSASTTIKKNFLSNSSFVQVYPTDTVTITAHGFTNGNNITFSSTGTLPTGLTAGTQYYVVNKTTDTFQVSESIGGSVINVSDVGTGLHTVIKSVSLTEEFSPEDIDFSTDTITLTNHDFANGDRVLLSTSDTLPTPLSENTFYYVVGAAANTLQLSTTVGGTAIDITYNGEGIHTISKDITVLTFDQVPDNITEGALVDFLQTNTGHRTYSYDVLIPTRSISGLTISFATEDIPDSFIVGDYIATANECIIPQIPSDFHNGLAERACARILASMGDTQGLQTVQQKINEIDKNQGSLLSNRTEGSPQKVVARHSLLRYGRKLRS